MSDLVEECAQDRETVVPFDPHERSGLVDHASRMDLLGHLQAELLSHPAPEIDQLLECRRPPQFVDDEARKGKVARRRVHETCVPALVDVHEIHRSSTMAYVMACGVRAGVVFLVAGCL